MINAPAPIRTSPPSSNPGSLHRAIDFYFEISIYLLVLTGFATLASTGGLDLPSLVLTSGALALAGFMIAKGQLRRLPDRWTSPLTLAYFAFFAVDYFIVSHNFLPATVHLTLFGVVIRLFSLRRERDYVMLAILSFLMVLASAVLTVNSVFLFAFAAFLLMAVATFVLMEMRRSSQSASVQVRQPDNDPGRNHFAASLVRLAPVLMLLILIAAAVLFFLLPRKPTGYFGGYAFGTDFSSGFSDRVQLGQIGRIQQSNAVVMHVQIDADTQGRYDLHWRGVALADFDGYTWSKPREQYVLRRWSENSFEVPQFLEASGMSYIAPIASHSNIIHYRVLMEPIGTNVFFLAPWARTVTGSYRLLAADAGGAVYNFDSQRPVSRYEAESDIAAPSPMELRQASSTVPPQIAASYLHLPPLDPRVPRLAAEISGAANNNFDKAAALETYLRTRLGYTLELPRTIPKDPIANFLFERKQGHCEYFASAMAVMLRTIGIPSRVVNGFRSDEFNDLTGNYVVRGKDAHAWVEAYFPGYGWQTFDPTPAGHAAPRQGLARVGLYIDAMASFWRDWIVSYDTSHQYVLGQTVFNGTRGMWEDARNWARRYYDRMLRWARRSQHGMEIAPQRWEGLAAAIVALVLLLGNLQRIVRWVLDKRLERYPERSPEHAATMWYQRMVRSLEKRGIAKPVGQTPHEFAHQIEDIRLQAPVAEFTEVYESARYGNSAEDARRLPQLFERVASAVRD